MQPGNFFVLTPACPVDPSLAIAACRAGARGTLDLEYAADPDTTRQALNRLEKFTRTAFGARVSLRSADLLDAWCRKRPERLGWIILSGGTRPDLANWIERLTARGIDVFVECVDLLEMRQAVAARATGLVLKGHEAGGRVGDDTTFILIQQWFREVAPQLEEVPPVWVQGGIGLHTVAGCAAAGVAGVVLDSQVLLARESSLSQSTRNWISNFDGSQTAVFGKLPGQRVRVAHWPRSPLGEALTEAAKATECSAEQASEIEVQAWQAAVARALELPCPWQVRMLGQDAICAASLAQRFCTVGGIVQALAQSAREGVELARQLRPLDEGSRLATSHGTRYPIVQGPMTRVSDTAAFAESVARAGALPFLALALLRKAEVERLLAETQARVGSMRWGAGILGFLPPEIRDEQTAAIREARPPFVLIAGGRPDQARQFEELGIPTYLHVPSPSLLRMFLKEGAKRIVLEGRECGGHVGPRTSFALWDAACEVILEHLGKNGSGEELHVVFAGGIHDECSGAIVAALAARLAQRKVRIGLLMGTAYLFTREAVESGAIVPRFQEEALRCDKTVLLETGPGHAIRCIPTPYCDAFDVEKRRLEEAGRSAEEITRSLEWMNIGRLRVASKGVDRVAESPQGASRLTDVPANEQFARGMYMIGQVSTMRHELTTMAELHEAVCRGASELLTATTHFPAEVAGSEKPCDVAIIGLSCIYPGAGDLEKYWANILRRVYTVTEIPSTHWDWSLYYDADPMAKDKIVSKWGGFLPDTVFDPFQYGITPAAMKVIEPLQLLLLEAVRNALKHAGYDRRPFARERTAAVCGIGGGGSPVATFYGFRSCMPLLNGVPGLLEPCEKILKTCDPLLPEWTEDSFPGFLMNVAVGRIANRFNLGGPNYAVDAACASSLAAVQLCVRELQAGTSDVALAMGADTVQTPFAYMAFSKTFALSRAGRCRPFDAAADGIVLSEGIGVLVMKRLADAERDGDEVLAVIRGVGSSSDGREKGLTAPNALGQTRALQRAYRQAGISPSRVGLIEAHGTGTVVGDRTEAQSLGNFLRDSQAEPGSCAIGSVKSMIGHSKCAAGLAGMIKTTLALHHKVLPPTLVEQPNPNAGFDGGPLYLNTQVRPWIHGGEQPRCAGVSAFGFGGTNFHVVLEEYTGAFAEAPRAAVRDFETELLVVRRPTREKLLDVVQQVQQGLSRGGRPRLADLAASLARGNSADPTHPVLTLVVGSLDELREKLLPAIAALRGSESTVIDPRGIYFSAAPRGQDSRVALLFPGQGSQYPNMLADLALAFPVVRETLDQAEGILADRLPRSLGKLIFPPSTFDEQSAQRQADELSQTDVAQPALAAAGLAMFALLGEFGIEADFTAGHSFGEYLALAAANCLSHQQLLEIAHDRGRLMKAAAGDLSGGMAAVTADASAVCKALEGIERITLANLNSPGQTVISAPSDVLDQASERLSANGMRVHRLSVSCAFHSPHVAEAAEGLADVLRQLDWSAPRVPVYSNRLAERYPVEPEKIVELLAGHLTSPVRFQEEIESLYSAGARIFVEVGPQGVLTNLVKQILECKPHQALATDLKGRSGVTQMAHVLGQLLAAGVDVKVSRWFEGRHEAPFDLADLEQQTLEPPVATSAWIINGVRARPVSAPEPLLLGQRLSEGAVPVVEPASFAPSEARVAPADSARPASLVAGTIAAPGDIARPAQLTPLPQNESPPMNNREIPQTLPAPGAAVDDVTMVMCRYQDLMARFLDSQQAALRDYFQVVAGGALASEVNAAPALPSWSAAQPVAPVTAEAAPNTVLQQTPARVEAIASVEVPSRGAVSAPETAETPATAAEPSKVTRKELTRRLLELVSKRTGYPQEMLAVDLDLEADLGVDSIKRVEILGSLAESLGGTESELGGKLELEKLTGLRTLQAILDYLDQTIIEGSTAPDAGSTIKIEEIAPIRAPSRNGHPAATDGAQSTTELEVQRAVVELIAAPIPSASRMLIPAGPVLITMDDQGIAATMGERLSDLGQRVVYLHADGRKLAGSAVDEHGRRPAGSAADEHGRSWPDGFEDYISADLSNADQVARLGERLRTTVGQIAGIVHLAPLAEAVRGETPAQRAWRDVHSLYLLAREFGEDLERSAAQGGAMLLAGMSLGGRLGFESHATNGHYQSGHGGMAGFLKCVAQEWDGVLVRAVDLNLSLPVEDLAELLLAELRDPQGPAEVGLSSQGRVTWRPVQAPLVVPTSAAWPLPPAARVMITGGARGITAKVAVALAKFGRPHLILAGRTPLPAENEPAELEGLSEASDIKRVIIERARASGGSTAPAAIESEYRRRLAEREVRATLRELTELGSTWEYHAVDVRDREAFGRLIEQVNQEGPLAGLIHGAGVIEDRLLRDKTPDSFERVWRTKVDSAYTLADRLDASKLQFAIFFASLASRYGNRGQSDYAAANEVLSKLAIELDRRWSGRVCSIAWGPWSGVGMVADLAPHLTRRGLKLIDPAEGPEFVIAEIMAGKKGVNEVIVAGGAEHLVRPKTSPIADAAPAV